MKGFIGAANIDTNSRLCMSSAVTGYKRAFGADVVPCSYDDVENSDLVVLVGSNAAWAHPVLFQRLAQAKRDNPRLRIVAIDPDAPLPARSPTAIWRWPREATAGCLRGCLTPWLRQEPASMAFATARRRWPPPAAGTWRGWRPFAVCLPMRWRDSIASSSPPRGRSPSTPWESINPPAAATNVTPSSTSIWPAGSMAAAAAALSLTGQPNAMGGREVGGLATMLAAHMDFVPDDLQRLARFWGRNGWRRPRADRRGAVCRHWPRRGQSGLDHGYQPGGVAP